MSDVLRCLHAWSQDPTGRGQVPVTIAALHGEYPALYAALYAQLTNEVRVYVCVVYTVTGDA